MIGCDHVRRTQRRRSVANGPQECGGLFTVNSLSRVVSLRRVLMPAENPAGRDRGAIRVRGQRGSRIDGWAADAGRPLATAWLLNIALARFTLESANV